MNEAETRAELIDPKLKESGWGVAEGSKILREYQITAGKIQTGGGRAKPLIADYVLVHQGRKLAAIEAKSAELAVGEGVAQAKNYAEKMHLDTTFSSNGKEIYQICMKTGTEGLIAAFPTPDELWNKTFAAYNRWRDKFNQVPFEDVGGTKSARYYQEIAVNNTMAAIAEEKQRILLTLATGTGKTFIAFQIAWKLFQTRWNLKRDGARRPRILFLTDRNILADQAFNAFSAFPEDALVRINPREIGKKGSVPTNGSIFFTIFQTFMTGKDNVDTYRYFGDPVYIYSLKEGINDGFLTPFKVKRIKTTLDDYIYTSDDQIIEGEVEEGKIYIEPDFNRIIEIKERESKRVQILLSEVNQNEKAIVFCATQDHAAAVRDLINQYKKSKEPNYCVRVTANDGALGDQYLREFRDNEKTIPTILTTSQKLSTGVDARNIRNIVLMRPVNSMIEFKQIVGRGTRLFDGKEYFTIYDFVDAYHHFSDPEWDGEPIDETTEKPGVKDPQPPYGPKEPPEPPPDGEEKKKRLKIKLRDGKEREIQHMISTSFWGADGKPISAEEFLQNLFGALPAFFKSEDELRTIWSYPMTRKTLLEKLAAAGYGKDELATMQTLIDAEKSDLFDVLEYVSFAVKPITREARVAESQSKIFALLNNKQKDFLEFVLSKYIETGVEELDQEKLPELLTLKYHALSDAAEILGGVENIRTTFIDFQKYLYEHRAA